MRLALTGRGVVITPDLRRLVQRKLARVERILNDKGVSGQVELRLEKFRHVCDLLVHARGGHMLEGRFPATAWDVAIAGAVDKVIQQAQKLKGKWQERKREARPLKRELEAAVPAPRAGRAAPARRKRATRA